MDLTGALGSGLGLRYLPIYIPVAMHNKIKGKSAPYDIIKIDLELIIKDNIFVVL